MESQFQWNTLIIVFIFLSITFSYTCQFINDHSHEKNRIINEKNMMNQIDSGITTDSDVLSTSESFPNVGHNLNTNNIDNDNSNDNNNNNNMNDRYSRLLQDSSSSVTNNLKFLVSYSIYHPGESNKICDENLNFFLDHGVVNDVNAQFVFTISSGYQDSPIYMKPIKSFSNIKIVEVNGNMSYIQRHHKIIKENINNIDIFVLLSCSSIGPFYLKSTKDSSMGWMVPYINKLQGNVKVVSSTISCESSVHIQSYAMIMNKEAATIAIDIWSKSYTKDMDADIAFTSAILAKGFNIASLDSRFLNRNFVGSNVICDPQFHSTIGNSNLADPLVCQKGPYGPIIESPGCLGQHPCEAIFIKLNRETTAKETIDQIALLRAAPARNPSRDYTTGMCIFGNMPARPFWDTAKLYRNISSFPPNIEIFSKQNITSKIVIVLRCHSSYGRQLLSFLWALEGIRRVNHEISVIIMPTEAGSAELLKNMLLVGYWTGSHKKHVNIFIIDFPEWLFVEYGAFLPTLCTEKWKKDNINAKRHSVSDIGRHCNVNSPLHYLLVDLTLYYVKEKFHKSTRLLVTNADNLYSPYFFENLISEKYTNYDIVMTNMVTRGRPIYSKPVRGEIDLGGYATGLEFLLNTGITFLNSLPSHPEANHYHDDDAHFLMRLVTHHAKLAKVEEFDFFHI